jgi:hypothetical protein
MSIYVHTHSKSRAHSFYKIPLVATTLMQKPTLDILTVYLGLKNVWSTSVLSNATHHPLDVTLKITIEFLIYHY